MTANRERFSRAVTCIGCAVAISAVLGAPILVPSINAQTKYSDDRATSDYTFLTDTATYEGYWNGFARGADDLKIGPEFTSRDDEIFVRAEAGYSPEMGPLPKYQRAFRRAYIRGYDDAHAGRDRDPKTNLPPAPPEPMHDDGPSPLALVTHGQVRYTDVVPESRDRRPSQSTLPWTRNDIMAIGTASGYREGFEHGTSDRTSLRSFGAGREGLEPQPSKQDPLWSADGSYRTGYRVGYLTGYRAAYPQPFFDGKAESVETDVVGAEANGYRNGYERGEYDRNSATPRIRPQTLTVYKDGLEGWAPRFGGQASYKRTFRASLIRGYDDGYTGRKRSASFVRPN